VKALRKKEVWGVMTILGVNLRAQFGHSGQQRIDLIGVCAAHRVVYAMCTHAQASAIAPGLLGSVMADGPPDSFPRSSTASLLRRCRKKKKVACTLLSLLYY
jgi:hypothetical protein